MPVLRQRRLGSVLPAAVLAAAASPPWAVAQEPAEHRWRDTAEFSYVVTSGNAETSTFGLKNKLWRTWERASFEFNAGGVRAESERVTRAAVGTQDDFSVQERSETDVTAESYYLNGRYDRKLTDRFFWFGGGGWERNRFAGVEDRWSAAGGVGNVWVDRDTVKFRTDYAVTGTKQEDVVENPEVDDTFLGARVSWAYLHTFGAATTYTNDLVLDENLEETSDFRANMINSVAVAINTRLALKVSLQLLYDNDPSFVQVDLFDPADPPPGGTPTGTKVAVELDELDSLFTASLVVNF